nr:unnamed protein product [Spirometra erinaceieuropaei]
MVSTVRQPNQLLVYSAPTEVPYLPRKHKSYGYVPSTSETSSTAPPPSQTPPSKIFTRNPFNCLNNHLQQGLLPENQYGFRRLRVTPDILFTSRQLQEKCQEMRTHLYSTFMTLTKAFDTVGREELRKIMQKFNRPERFTHMVRQLHSDMMAQVTDNGAVSVGFAVTSGVKHGCVSAPTLSSLMFSAMLIDAYRD